METKTLFYPEPGNAASISEIGIWWVRKEEHSMTADFPWYKMQKWIWRNHTTTSIATRAERSKHRQPRVPHLRVQNCWNARQGPAHCGLRFCLILARNRWVREVTAVRVRSWVERRSSQAFWADRLFACCRASNWKVVSPNQSEVSRLSSEQNSKKSPQIFLSFCRPKFFTTWGLFAFDPSWSN